MIVYPNAKINLGLHVIGKRSDGFHNIETLMVPCYEICDILEIVKTPKTTISLYGLKYEGKPEDNICFKAYKLLASKYDIPPVGIHLYKKIPVGSGLGGGSSDAAFTLVTLNKIFSLSLSDDILASLAAELGSDCPFFVYNKPMIASGRGEILTPFPMSLDDYEIKLINPEIFISTSDAYKDVKPSIPKMPLHQILLHPVSEWKNLLVNDFEKTVFERYPQLSKIKESLYESGAQYASMSGSGSAMYGIFKKHS